MPRPTKVDEYYEKTEHSGKIFMYCSPSWNVLFPIVDIIRLLKKNTLIWYKYGKGQALIKNYGSQYYHCLVGCDLKHKNDYLENLKMVRCIFIFTDESDPVATNLINIAKQNKISVVCYSNLDHVYHFYKNGISKVVFDTPAEVVDKMYELYELNEVKKLAELFPDFEILSLPPDTKKSTLEECMEMMKTVTLEEKKKKDSHVANKIYFDPASNKLKKMEYERSQKNRTFEEKNEVSLRSFFKPNGKK